MGWGSERSMAAQVSPRAAAHDRTPERGVLTREGGHDLHRVRGWSGVGGRMLSALSDDTASRTHAVAE
jgi:hypothetical protein